MAGLSGIAVVPLGIYLQQREPDIQFTRASATIHTDASSDTDSTIYSIEVQNVGVVAETGVEAKVDVGPNNVIQDIAANGDPSVNPTWVLVENELGVASIHIGKLIPLKETDNALVITVRASSSNASRLPTRPGFKIWGDSGYASEGASLVRTKRNIFQYMLFIFALFMVLILSNLYMMYRLFVLHGRIVDGHLTDLKTTPSADSVGTILAGRLALLYQMCRLDDLADRLLETHEPGTIWKEAIRVGHYVRTCSNREMIDNCAKVLKDMSGLTADLGLESEINEVNEAHIARSKFIVCMRKGGNGQETQKALEEAKKLWPGFDETLIDCEPLDQ